MIGQNLGTFLIEEKIGSGAMGVVYRALHQKTGKTAAVKIITGDAGVKSNVPERFEREADILQKFRHPNIVRFLARGRYQGTNYVAMEYLTGGTLEDLLDKESSLPWREVVDYAIQICDALHYAHQQQIIHRDLKPSNLLFSDKRQMKLTDFGIAKDDSEDAEALTATGRTLGTAAYMAPEQIKGEPKVSHKTDLYALGCLLFQMLTGQTPFRGSSPVVLMHMHLSEKAPRVSSKVPDIPRALDDLILALMAKDPSKRPFDAEKVKQDLLELKLKAKRGEAIPSVFQGGASPARLGMNSPTTATDFVSPASPSSLATSATRSGTAVRGTWFDRERLSEALEPERLKVGGMVAVLAAGLVFLVYMLWPASAEDLLKQGETLMATSNIADWQRAERDVIAELDRRFPDKYPEQKRAWRDKFTLETVRRRAVVLESPTADATAFSRPKPGPETTFVTHANLARAAAKIGGDTRAVKVWKDMTRVLNLDDPVERPWVLLAQNRIRELEEDIANRLAIVTKLLDEADTLARDRKDAEADRLRESVVEQYGLQPDLHDLIRRRAGLDPLTGKPLETAAPPSGETPSS